LITAAVFDGLVVHDYNSGETGLIGDKRATDRLESQIAQSRFTPILAPKAERVTTNFSQDEYVAAVLEIQERIRDGDTYQTNLTRRITAELPDQLTPAQIFWRIRNDHPASFAAFIDRNGSTVISASPERFFRIENGVISTSPIKGTRPRGKDPNDDARLRNELLRSPKDRAENTMIVDLLRNDLGRICEFGSVRVEQLCDLEEHPSLFHLVSTVSGRLRSSIEFADVIRALFPCGSITGAPKISTMGIIDQIESSARGLSMGAIGIYMPASFGMGEFIDTSVAIRTMTIRGSKAELNVGGGIVIDSDPRAEYAETVVKSKALLHALGVDPTELSTGPGV
jgi:para-aminobenzoate synthetase component 1